MPIVATSDMRDAVTESMIPYRNIYSEFEPGAVSGAADDIYRAMLAAAPQPDTKGNEND